MNLIKKVVLPWLFMYLLIPVDSLAMSESEQERLSLERSRSSSSSRLSDFIYSDVSGSYKRECFSIKLAPSDIQPPENIIPITLLQEQRRKYSPAIILSKDGDLIELLPDEILWRIFTFLDINDLGRVAQVSTRWNKITEISSLWRFMGAKYYGDFLSSNDLAQNPKQQVIYHYLSVIVFSTIDLTKIAGLVRHYRLNLYEPFFKKNKNLSALDNFLISLVTDLSSREEFIAQGNEAVIRSKIEGLAGGAYAHEYRKRYGYEGNLDAAREFNETLIERGNQNAIERKISALSQGGDLDYSTYFGDQPIPDSHIYCTYGYEKNPAAARELNETLIERGDQGAIERKIEGLSFGRYGYEKNPTGVKEVNEILLIKRRDNKALERKIWGLAGGYYGYEKNPAAARELNEALIERGDQEAIMRKIDGLSYGQYGYEKNLAAVREFNESLVEKGDQGAIERKIGGWLIKSGTYCCEKNPDALREFIDALVKKGEPVALKAKIEGFAEGIYGYEKSPVAARELNENLVAQGDPEAIERRLNGLRQKYGYEYDQSEFIEALVMNDNEKAIWQKIGGLGRGNAYYKKNLNALREFIELLVSRGNIKAIMIKIEGLVRGESGYEIDPAAAREFIEDLLMSKNSVARGIGTYVKAFAMKYGISELGYKKDRKKAIDFIKENHIPY